MAYGPDHGLGFHPDPWGNVYGPLEALAYTGADLLQLGAHLLESPLPALALVGAALLAARRLPRGAGVLGAWALAGVAANALYWHHGVHMGPRFLYETGPAWVGLWAVSAWALLDTTGGRPFLRRFAGWVVLLSLGGAVLLASGTGAAYASRPSPPEPPEPPGARAVVFVHGSWPSRVAARLVATGMRRDSVETLLRRNDLCRLDRYARRREEDAAAAVPDSLHAGPGPTPAGLERRLLSPGNAVLLDPGADVDDACLRQAGSDRLGTLELEPLAWRNPPLSATGVVVARDLGPAANARTLEALPDRRGWVLVPGEEPVLLPYREGMRLLWRGAAGAGRSP